MLQLVQQPATVWQGDVPPLNSAGVYLQAAHGLPQSAAEPSDPIPRGGIRHSGLMDATAPLQVEDYFR